MDMKYNLIPKARCMVMQMNKHGFIEEIGRQTGYDKEKCIIISDSLEDNFLFGKNNKQKTINTLMNNLNCDEKEANHIYEVTHSIIVNAIKNRVKHPFVNLNNNK